MNYQTLNVETWPRAEHFKFYKDAANPWFNICCNIDVSILYRYCKQFGHSFFHAYLYVVQQAINNNDPFKYRIVADEVRIYPDIAVSVAILADDEMMRFCNLAYATPFSEFTLLAGETEQKVKSEPFIAANFVGGEMRQDVIHMSVLPWLNFTSFSNARNTAEVDSIPKVVFGKCTMQGNSMLMPLSVEVHHGVMDGLHVGRFVETLQELFDRPELLAPTAC
jgi:chloramphenicol O-acetyltransferase type A